MEPVVTDEVTNWVSESMHSNHERCTVVFHHPAVVGDTVRRGERLDVSLAT